MYRNDNNLKQNLDLQNCQLLAKLKMSTRLVSRSILQNCWIQSRKSSSSKIPQHVKTSDHSQGTRSRYLNYAWWKQRQRQRDQWYTSTEEDYERRKYELNELKDDNPIDESEYEMPPLDFNHLEQRGAHQSLDKKM